MCGVASTPRRKRSVELCGRSRKTPVCGARGVQTSAEGPAIYFFFGGGQPLLTQQDRSTPTRRWPLSDTHCRHGPGQLGFLSATSRDLHILGARTRAPLKRTRRGQGEASTGRERVGGSDPADRRSMRRATDANIAGRIATMTQHLVLRPRRQEELQELSCNKA